MLKNKFNFTSAVIRSIDLLVFYFVPGAGYGFAGLETVKAFNFRTAIISLHHVNTLVAAMCELSYSQNAVNTNNNPSKSNLLELRAMVSIDNYITLSNKCEGATLKHVST